MQLAWVADGRLSAAFGKRVMLWDVAAGALLIREAGGVITDPWGRDYVPFDLAGDCARELPYLAAGGGIHERMLATVREAECAR
jgi:myo-inositol-1(or 4)-monophosphatase